MKLQSDFGDWKSGEQLEDLIIDYFKNLFLASSSIKNIQFLSSLKDRVIENMNRELGKEFTTDEVYQALIQMHPTKVLRPDGMSPVFFQKYWHILGESTIEPVLSALNYGDFPTDINYTFLSLIPKKA